MARPLRLEFPGAVYHVTSRGNHDMPVFLKDEHPEAFLDIVAGTVQRYKWICHAYCLMENHYHLVVETPDGNLARGMRQVNAVYTQYFNRNEKKGGHLFQGRYKAILVEKNRHLLEIIRHVLRAPSAAGHAGSLDGYRWSSYRASARLEKPHRCLSCAWIHRQFRSSPANPGEGFAAYVGATDSGNPLEHVRGQVLLGSEEFCRKLKPVLAGQEACSEIPVAQRFVGRPNLPVLFSGATREKRDAIIADAVENWGYSQKEVADHLNLHYSSISRILKGTAHVPPILPVAVEVPEKIMEHKPAKLNNQSENTPQNINIRKKQDKSASDDQLALF